VKLYRQDNWGSIPVNGKDFFTTVSRSAFWPSQSSTQWCLGALASGVKRPGLHEHTIYLIVARSRLLGAWSYYTPMCLAEVLKHSFIPLYLLNHIMKTPEHYMSLPNTSNIRMMRWCSLVPVSSLIVPVNSMGTGYLFNFVFNGTCMVLSIVNGCMFSTWSSLVSRWHICVWFLVVLTFVFAVLKTCGCEVFSLWLPFHRFVFLCLLSAPQLKNERR